MDNFLKKLELKSICEQFPKLFKDAEKLCYHVNLFALFENGQFSQHRPKRAQDRKHFKDAEKLFYHVNVFSHFKNGDFSSTLSP